MAQARKPISVSIKSDNTSPNSLRLSVVMSRKDAAQILGGASIATLFRLEQAGVLKPVRLNPSRKGKVYYNRDEVLAVANGATHAER